MTTPDSSNPKTGDLAWRMLGWILDVAVLGLIAYSVSLNVRLSNLELWRAETAANRWTGPQQAAYQEQVSAELFKLWGRMAEDRAQIAKDLGDIKACLAAMPKETPPKWWENEVRSTFEKQDERIKELEKARLGK